MAKASGDVLGVNKKIKIKPVSKQMRLRSRD